MSAGAETATLTERQITGAPVSRFELDPWRVLGFRAGVTGRDGDFDLGLFADGRSGAVMENWLTFQASQRPEFRSLAVARQVHSADLCHHPETGVGWQVSDAVDGHVTSAPGLLLTVTVADCIPVYLGHQASHTIALLHAGWRGVAAGVLEKGIRELTTRANCSSSSIIMHCGVGICESCYEVGPEVIFAVTGRRTSRPEHLDLRGALAERASRLGVQEITVSTRCSSHDMDVFFSHRRSRGSDGRMLAYLGIPDAIA